MKAILRRSAGLLSLLLLSSVSHGQIAYSPVFKTPLPQAPTSSYYLPDGFGGWAGPFYSVSLPSRPFNGILPGPTGHGIMTGTLSHEFLLSKQAMELGNVPLLAKKKEQGAPEPPTTGMPQMGG